MIVDPMPSGRTGKRIISVEASSIYDRTRQLKRLGVRIVVCAALSDEFFHLLRSAGVQIKSGIAGAVEDVVAALGSGSLDQSRFRMPGA